MAHKSANSLIYLCFHSSGKSNSENIYYIQCIQKHKSKRLKKNQKTDEGDIQGKSVRSFY